MAGMGAPVTRARYPAALSGFASPASRWTVIAIVAAVSIACLMVPLVYGPSPVFPVFVFACFSAPYLVAGSIGWMLRPALGDPSLQVGYWSPAERVYLALSDDGARMSRSMI